MDPLVKAMALILAISLSKLKTHVIREKNIYSKNRFKANTSKWFTVCLKTYVGLGEIQRQSSQNKKEIE